MKRGKHSIYQYITILGVALLFTGCNSGYFNNFKTDMYTEKNMNYFGTDKKQIDTLTDIEINSSYSNIEIIASDDYYLEYQYYYVDNEPSFTLEDGKLSFDDTNMNKGAYSISLEEECFIKIYVPNTAQFEQVSITSTSGDVSLGSFSTENLSIENTYGNVVITRIDAKETKVTSTSGTLSLEQSFLGNADLTNIYGSIKLASINYDTLLNAEPHVLGGNISIEVTSGSVDIKDLLCENLYTDNAYGDIKMDGVFAQFVDAELSSGSLEFKDSKADSIDIHSIYGDLKLDLLGKEEDYRMDISTNYGSTVIGDTEYEGSVFIDKSGSKEIKIDATSGNITLNFKE